MNFTDVHSHVLWGVDDGVRTKEEASMCLRTANEEGINRLFVTPHVIPGKTDASEILDMKLRFSELLKMASEYSIELYSGCELMINRYMLEWIRLGLFSFLGNSKYLLCEFDPRHDIENLEDAEEMLYEITIRGIIPVIAHAERAFHGKVNLQRVREWTEMGCVIQINRSSIIGLHGKTPKANAFTLLDAGLCHLIGSDAHEAEGRRVLKLRDSYNVILKKYGSESASILFVDNPQNLILGNDMQDIKLKKRFSPFGRRYKNL